MRLNPAEFWNLSLREWVLSQRGFFEIRNQDYRTQWEQTRYVAFYAIKAMAGKGWPHTQQDMILFPWEELEKIPLTEEQMDYYLRKVGKYIDKDGNGYNA